MTDRLAGHEVEPAETEPDARSQSRHRPRAGAVAKGCPPDEVDLGRARDVLRQGHPVRGVGEGGNEPARNDEPRQVAILVEERDGVLVLDGVGDVDLEPAARIDERRADQGLTIGRHGDHRRGDRQPRTKQPHW